MKRIFPPKSLKEVIDSLEYGFFLLKEPEEIEDALVYRAMKRDFEDLKKILNGEEVPNDWDVVLDVLERKRGH